MSRMDGKKTHTHTHNVNYVNKLFSQALFQLLEMLEKVSSYSLTGNEYCTRHLQAIDNFIQSNHPKLTKDGEKKGKAEGKQRTASLLT